MQNTPDTNPSTSPAPLALQSQIENQNSKIPPVALAVRPADTLRASRSTLDLLSAPVSSSQALALIEAKPLLPAAPPEAGACAIAPSEGGPKRKKRRHGRVASLPKPVRDMVNRMLWNGVPYKNIVIAVGESGYALIERNISNWSTGGYLEWRLEQEAVLQNRLDQDHLLDFLRRDDAAELPEVGMQAAATRLLQVLLQKLAQNQDPEANLDNYTRLIDLVCRLNREIATTQQLRDASRGSLGPAHNPARIKDFERVEAIEVERFYSAPPSDAKLPGPAVPPLLPAEPTSGLLAQEDRQRKHDEKIARLEQSNAMMKALFGKKDPAPAPEPLTS